ncbi:MAG: hypothetical protein IKU99_06205 [Clostridia bacterium]|nr:hypothetical protein [Clostridia bacterium]
MNNCCICERDVEREDAPILAMGGAGYARVLCEECDRELQVATRGHDVDEIKAAINSLTTKLANGEPDAVTYRMMNEILVTATQRAMEIKDGTYDFARDDEEDNEGFDEIPEELLESEEDIELDKKDEEKAKKFDKVYSIILTISLIALGGMIVWRIIQALL